MAYTSLHSLNENGSRTMGTNLSMHDIHTPKNTTFREGCIEIRFSEMEYLPWDNPDNIVHGDVETTIRRIKDTSLVFFFLIGGPANVINMAVFYKQGLKDRVNLCLFALSLADELYLIAEMFFFGEQIHLQFTTGEINGPLSIFMANNNLVGFAGFSFVSQILSAIVASERCYCVLRPLKYQTLLRTRTMAAIISVVYITVLSLYFVVAFRYRVGCVHDPDSGIVLKTNIMGELYRKHKVFVDYLDSLVFGAALPVTVMIVVITTTIITVFKLRQTIVWRSETSSSMSSREVALTKMLVGSSILFIVCVFPFAVFRFSLLWVPELNTGRRHQNFFLALLWIVEILTFINASFNIFVYYLMGSRFRETFWALFSGKRKTVEK